MSERHFSREKIERFLDDELAAEESRAMQRHLFTCPRCEETMIALLPGWSDPEEELAEPAEEAGYESTLGDLLEQARTDLPRHGSRLDRERAEATGLWQEIEGASPERRREVVGESPRHQSWGLFEHLLEHAREAFFEDAREACSLLELALALAEGLDPSRYGEGAVEAARARAWAYLANARRLLADFQGAEAAFAAAEDHLGQSWLDPLDEALVLELKASLRRGQRRFDEATGMLDEAISLYREVNAPHLQGRTTINQGLVLLYAGDVEGALARLRSGLFLIDPAAEPRLVIVAQQNLVYCLNELGRPAEAWALIEDARPLWHQTGRRHDLVRLRWLEGKVAVNLDDRREAEAAFLEVRAAFLAEQMPYDVALVSLDLAAIYAREGRTAEARRLAAEMLPIFQSREVHREALAALLVFQQAAETERLTLALVEEVAAYLERARGNPDLPFRELPAESPG